MELRAAFPERERADVGRRDASVGADEVTPVKAHDKSDEKRGKRERTNSRTDKRLTRLTARQLKWSSVGRAGRKHTKTKWENGPNGCLPFRRGWVRVLIQDRGPENRIRYELRKGENSTGTVEESHSR